MPASALEGHNVVMQYFAQDEATRMDPEPTVYETLASGSPLQMVPAIRNILGGFLFSGDDVYKPRARAVGRRAHAAGGRAHAAASVERPAPRRADEPSRSRFEGSAARRAGRLRRHARLRLARPLLRRAARDEDHRDRRRRRAASIPGTYKEFLWHKEHPQESCTMPSAGLQAGSQERDGQERQDGRARGRAGAAARQKPRT